MAIEVKFNNQAYLNSYLDDILSKINPKYKHISTLDTSTKSFPEILALLNGKSESLNITKLKTYQYNALIPKVRLYRVNSTDNSEYEFVFDKDYRTTFIKIKDEINESLTTLNTGNNAGIKSFNWNLAGTNPVTAEKNIEVKVELYFDSINAFSGGSYDEMLRLWNSPKPDLTNTKFDDPKTKTTTNFWSLVYHPSLKKQPGKYDSPLFRIKAVVGWEQIPPTILNELFSQYPNINEEFMQSDLSMYLNLVAHQFNFKDDGSILLSLNYIGSIENSYSNTNFDLLKGLKEQLNRLNNNTLKQLREDYGGLGDQSLGAAGDFVDGSISDISRTEASRRLTFLSYYKSKNGKLDQLNSALKCAGLSEIEINGTSNQEILGKAVEEQSEKYNNTLTKIDEYIQKASLEIKTVFYSRLITNLITNSSEQNAKKSMYAVEISKETVKQWLLWKEGTQENNAKPAFSATTNEASNSDDAEIDKRSKVLALEREAGDTAEFYENFVGANGPDTFDEAMDLLTKDEEKVDRKRIYFTTVGHVVDAALNIIEENLETDKKTEFERQKIIFSNFSPSFEVKDNKATSFKSLATIPIDLTFLIKFLNDVLYSTGATEYSFYQFIRQLMVKVIEPALESREIPNDEVNKYSNTSLASTIVFLGSEDPAKHPLSNYYSAPPESRIINLSTTTKNEFSKHYLGNKTNLNVFNYYIIYDKYHKDYNVTGNLVEDRKRGVYHYTIGQDYGLVKAINFKKIDQPFLKESKSVGKKTIYLGQFRDLYNAEIKMIGNNIYHPGMLLFVKPSVEFGNPIGKTGAPTFSQITGVGGYFSVIKVNNEINQEAYTTTLDCVFHSNELAGEGTSSNPGCTDDASLEELKAAGLISGDKTTPINQEFLLDLDESIRNQGKEDALQEIKKEAADKYGTGEPLTVKYTDVL